jgi:response regulator NasT
MVCAVVLTAEELNWFVLEEAREAGVQALLPKPLTEQVLIPALEIAISTFRRYREVALQNRKLREELETRRLVERAKGLLMQTRGWSEAEAYAFLRRASMNRGLPLRRVARAVLEGHLGT